MSARSIRRSRDSTGMRVLMNAVLLLVAFFFGAPFLWIVAASFDADPGKAVPWPNEFTMANYRYLFDEQETGRALLNSLLVAGSAMVLGTFLAALAGFGLSRIEFRGKGLVTYGIIVLYTLPLAATMVAIYDLAGRLDLIDTYRGLILAETAIMLPFLVWLMKQFYDAVPRYLDEAARLDGRSVFQFWREVASPVARTGIALTAALAFMTAWAEVLLVIILISDADKATLPLQFFFAADGGGSIETTAALAVLYLLPVLVVFLIARKFIVRSLVSTTRGT